MRYPTVRGYQPPPTEVDVWWNVLELHGHWFYECPFCGELHTDDLKTARARTDCSQLHLYLNESNGGSGYVRIAPSGWKTAEEMDAWFMRISREKVLRLSRILELEAMALAGALIRRPKIRGNSGRIRALVLERDRFRCRRCGQSSREGASLEIDHIVPVSHGGTDLIDNLQTLCARCNNAKADSLPLPHDLGEAM